MTAGVLQAELGDEYDEALRVRVMEILEALGGQKIAAHGAVTGANDYSLQVWRIGDAVLNVEAETYMGLSVEGPAALVAVMVERLAAAGFSPRLLRS